MGLRRVTLPMAMVFPSSRKVQITSLSAGNRARVLGFAGAQPADGGGGAFYVLLKRRR